MDFYPSEFSPEARDRVEKQKIRAYRELLPSSVYDSNEQDLAIRCVMLIFLTFAKEACALRKERGWTIERVDRESKEFLRLLTIMVVFDKFPGLDRRWLSNLNGSIEPNAERRFRASVEWKEYEELLLTTPASAPEVASNRDLIPKSWQPVEITFLSDERVEICCDGIQRKTYNYGELGFEDRRNGTPNRAWIMLREMAKLGGTIPRSSAGKERAMIQKRIEEIRQRLQDHFKIDTDPIPFNGSAYQTSFKIGRRPSSDT
jgi:hypothetical protein